MGIANARLEAAELQIRQNRVLRSHLLSPNIPHKMSQRVPVILKGSSIRHILSKYQAYHLYVMILFLYIMIY